MSNIHFGHHVYSCEWLTDALNEEAQTRLEQHQHITGRCDCTSDGIDVNVVMTNGKYVIVTPTQMHHKSCPLCYEPNQVALNLNISSGIKRAKKVNGFLPSHADVNSALASTHGNPLNELLAYLWTQTKLTHYYQARKHFTSWHTVSKAITRYLLLNPVQINGKALIELLSISTPRACFYTSQQGCSEMPVSATVTQASFILGELEDLWPLNAQYPLGDYLMRIKFMGQKQTILVNKNMFEYMYSQYTQALIAFQTKQPFKFVVLAKVYRRNAKFKSQKQGLVLDSIALLTTNEYFLPVQTVDELKQIKFGLNLHKKSMIKPVNEPLVRLPMSSKPIVVPLAKNRCPLTVSLDKNMKFAS